MPLAVVVLGAAAAAAAAAAFATNAAKQSTKTEAMIDAFYYDHSRPFDQKCQPIKVDYVNFVTEKICTNLSETEQYWETDPETGLSCTDLLYKID